MSDLSSKKCVPCEGGILPLNEKEYMKFMEQLKSDWQTDGKQISRDFTFKDFNDAMNFVNKVADIAKTEDHHPDINLHNYKKVLITLSTHAINGLSENDFVLAAKIEQIISPN